jgi:hypothetical protein
MNRDNIIYLLVCDSVRAKIYRTVSPPGELTLIYQQVNFGGQVADFAMSLCKQVRADRRAGKFVRLALMASSELLAAIDSHMDGDCRRSVVGTAILDAGQHTSQELLARLSNMLSADYASASK